MRKSIFTLLLAAMTVADVCAEQIAVVTESGTTSIYQTLDQAIANATDGSVIYLPGGGLDISSNTKVTKRVTIIGVSHKYNADNADGSTIIGGDVNFAAGSDGSALMGVYATGDVIIGSSNDSVQNIVVRYCNVNSIQIKHSGCRGIVVNQNYLRDISNLGKNNVSITNCVLHSIDNVSNGTINHNVITSAVTGHTGNNHPLYAVNNSLITNNVFCYTGNSILYYGYESKYNQIFNNISGYYGSSGNTNNNTISQLLQKKPEDLFVNPGPGVSVESDFHLKDSIGIGAGTDGTDIGIYGGTGFKDDCIAPIPRIVSKNIPEQTDAEGKLNIRIEAKLD